MTKVVAIDCELMLLRWAETSNGGRTVTFQVDELSDGHPFKDYAIKSGKRAGQRFQAVLVELGPNDEPIEQQPAKAKGGTLARSAALICQNVDFIQWAVLSRPIQPEGTAVVDFTEDGAAQFVRKICGIKSRSELDSNPEAATKFHALMRDFNHWKESQIV